MNITKLADGTYASTPIYAGTSDKEMRRFRRRWEKCKHEWDEQGRAPYSVDKNITLVNQTCAVCNGTRVKVEGTAALLKQLFEEADK